jgi:hypothetical protein
MRRQGGRPGEPSQRHGMHNRGQPTKIGCARTAPERPLESCPAARSGHDPDATTWIPRLPRARPLMDRRLIAPSGCPLPRMPGTPHPAPSERLGSSAAGRKAHTLRAHAGNWPRPVGLTRHRLGPNYQHSTRPGVLARPTASKGLAPLPSGRHPAARPPWARPR